jgi:hypothetical protein
MKLTNVSVIILLSLAAFITTAQERKPLSLHPDNPHYFLFRDKPAVLIGSTEHYGAVLNQDFDYVPYLDELAKHHLNLTRTFSGTYREIPGSFGITDNTLAPKPDRYLAPWPRSQTPGANDGLNKFDPTTFNEAYFTRLKDFLSQASKRGVVVEYVLFCTLYNDDLWRVSPMNPQNHSTPLAGDVSRTEVFTLKHKDLLAIQEAFVRKAVTELNAFDNVYFEICNEPYFAGVADDWQAHIAQLIADTEKPLPNKHLIAQNIANNQKKVDKPTPNVSILNFHYARPPETVALNYRHNLPIADDETGFDGKEDVHYRTEAWDFLMAGGAAYDNLDYSFTAQTPTGTLKNFKSPGGGSPQLRESLAALKTFMESFNLPNLKPANGIIKSGRATVPLTPRPKSADRAPIAQLTARALADEKSQTYALYLKGGTHAELTLTLPPGHYTADWIDTKTGTVIKSQPLDHKGGDATLSSPDYTEDIALRVAG